MVKPTAPSEAQLEEFEALAAELVRRVKLSGGRHTVDLDQATLALRAILKAGDQADQGPRDKPTLPHDGIILELITSPAVMAIPVEDTGLCFRIYAKFKPYGLNTLGDLLGCTDEDMLKVSGFGRSSLRELKVLLGSNRYRLRLQAPNALPPVGDSWVELQIGRVLQSRLADTPVARLPWRSPTHQRARPYGHNALLIIREADIETIGGLANHTHHQIAQMPWHEIAKSSAAREALEVVASWRPDMTPGQAIASLAQIALQGVGLGLQPHSSQHNGH